MWGSRRPARPHRLLIALDGAHRLPLRVVHVPAAGVGAALVLEVGGLFGDEQGLRGSEEMLWRSGGVGGSVGGGKHPPPENGAGRWD